MGVYVPENLKPVIIESPYAGKNPVHYRRNIAYLHRIIQDCLARGEVPFASHGFYPGALDDTIPEQRKAGIEAGFKTAEFFHALGGFRIFCRDRNTSTGMVFGEQHSDNIGMLRIDRSFGPEWKVENDPKYCIHPNAPSTREKLDAPEHCPDCDERFETVTLPLDAIQVALDYLKKKA
jgi:hypothetical protein